MLPPSLRVCVCVCVCVWRCVCVCVMGGLQVGVELGGALKNVLAIACGISDGMGFGNNSRAALITRGADASLMIEQAAVSNS